ncbi:MAG: hypothetical protein J6X54_00100 [Treponema sp.]|nr:hypothetical protein [Treponema sp.]
MKKLLAIALVAGSLISGVFGQEKTRLDNISLVLPVRMLTSTAEKGIGIDWHGYTFSSNLFGFCTGASFWVPMSLFDSNTNYYEFYMDGSFGVAFKVLDTDMLQVILSPGGTISMYDLMDSGFRFDFGIFGDACASFKLLDDLYLSAGVQMNYYLYSWTTIPGYYSGTDNKTFLSFSPRIGITYFGN